MPLEGHERRNIDLPVIDHLEVRAPHADPDDPPFPLLEKAGVSFDPKLNRIASQAVDKSGAGLVGPIALTFLCC